KQQVTDDTDGPIGFALDGTDRLELLALELVLEQQLSEGRDAGERVVQLMGDTGHELTDRGELLGSPEVVGDFLFFSKIPDADDQTHDVVVPVANVAERHRRRKFRPVLAAVNVLAGPQRLVELKSGNRLTSRCLSG